MNNSVAGDALEIQSGRPLNDATVELQRHPRESLEHLQEYQKGVRRLLSEVQQKVQVQHVASRQELDNLRHELSQSLGEGSHCQNLYHTGKSRSSSEIQQLRQERDHLHVHGRNLETETLAC